MEIANKWAKGEDSVRRDRTRPRKDDQYDDARYLDEPNHWDRRRKRRASGYDAYDGADMVTAGFDKRNAPQRITGDRNSGYRTSGFRDRNTEGYRTPQNREWRPRPAPVVDDHHMAREELSGPCTFHFFYEIGRAHV